MGSIKRRGGTHMNINEIIKTKRDQKELTTEQIDFFVREYSLGNIPDYQASSLLMAIYLNGMSEKEIYDLTVAMTASGEIVDLSQIEGIKVDKHSTGGIGDKVTMVVMPLVASCGVPVAKMSGRGLGYTQGTIDKLDSIPNFRTDIEMDEFIRNVKRIGIALMGQSEKVALADKKLYALRDVTATVESIPLIASSIMSKKLAAGCDKILLEVTCGSGAFMEDEVRARVLAQTMVDIGRKARKETIAVLTNMNQPLGKYAGNALEVKEAIETLRGNGEPDVVRVCLVLGAYMLKLAGVDDNIPNNIKLLQSKIDSGEGLEKFKEMISRQWGDVRVIDDPELLPKAKYRIPLNSLESGYIAGFDAKVIGQAVVNLGGGRLKKEDSIDYAVGIETVKKIGDEIKEGEPILYIHANTETQGLLQIETLRSSIKISKEPVAKAKEILDIIE
jgi:pyrimidine-nucleoside phosphorylase